MNKRTERLIKKIYEETYKKVFNKKTIRKALNANNVEVMLCQLQASKEYNEFAEEFAKRLTKAGLSKQKGIWRKYYKAAKEKHLTNIPVTYSDYEKLQYKLVVQHNFLMIKSVPEKIKAVYEQKDVQIILAEVLEGKVARGAFEKALREHGYKNAKMIARTEAAKLETKIDETRATSLGSVCYEWRSSKDKRTRKSHMEMDGVIVFWRPDSQKPLLDKMRGNAGEFPNCRCLTLALLDEKDLNKSMYKVYDYRIDKIVKMNKTALSNAIKKGGLR